MKRFISISSHPGTTGSTYYNHYFSRLGINASYEARGYDSVDDAVSDLKNIPDLCGISVSMPFKAKIINYLDIADRSVEIHRSCNTIKISGDVWTGHNTDLAGAVFIRNLIKEGDRVTLLGNGSMGSMIRKAITNAQVHVFARSLENWNQRNDTESKVIINATALGTINNESPLLSLPKSARLVIDLAIKPNDLQKQCLDAGVPYIGGIEFYKRQFFEQFRIYCNIDPDPMVFDEISSHLAQQHGGPRT